MTREKATGGFLTHIAELSNQYFLFRHGESYANKEGIIVSNPDHALSNYGLTAKGRKEVAMHIKRAKMNGSLSAVDAIITSPFLRALQSAEIASEILGATFEVDERLRERNFGDLELTTEVNYGVVWAKDRENPSHTEWRVESTVAVLGRTTELVKEVEARMRYRTILLCTHGDVASIIICGFLNENLGRHRDIGVIRTGEIRRLVLQK